MLESDVGDVFFPKAPANGFSQRTAAKFNLPSHVHNIHHPHFVHLLHPLHRLRHLHLHHIYTPSTYPTCLLRPWQNLHQLRPHHIHHLHHEHVLASLTAPTSTLSTSHTSSTSLTHNTICRLSTSTRLLLKHYGVTERKYFTVVIIRKKNTQELSHRSQDTGVVAQELTSNLYLGSHKIPTSQVSNFLAFGGRSSQAVAYETWSSSEILRVGRTSVWWNALFFFVLAQPSEEIARVGRLNAWWKATLRSNTLQRSCASDAQACGERRILSASEERVERQLNRNFEASHATPSHESQTLM